MTTIGTLTIEMAANVARLQQDLQAARGSVDSTFASIGSSVAKLKALVGTVFAGIAVGELLGAVEKVKTAAVDIERIAAASGASLDEFQRAAAGAKTVGVNLEKFGDIMKDTQDKLGDFLLTGGGELKDFFETIGPKVGVTAESFRNLSGPQALQLFYTSLEKAGVGQKVMIQQMESIADDASMLAPLLANGGAEFKSLGEEAAKAGALMSSDLIYASKALGEEMMRMDTVVGGITNSIMAELIPAITKMAAASREELSAGFEAVSAWVQDNKEHLLGAWELTKSIGAEVWSIVKVAIELAVGIGKWAVESGFLEASLITIGLLVAGFKDGVDIVGAAFAKLGGIILNAVAKPMSGFLNDVGVVLKWAGQGDLAGVFLDAAEGIKTAGEAGAAYADGVASKFAAGDTAVARFTAGLGASTQAAQAAAKSTYKAYQALGTGAGVSAKATEEAKKSADKAAAAAQKLAEEGVKLAASLLAQDSGLSGDFAAKWGKLNAAYKAGAVSLADLTQAQKLLLAEQPAMKAAADARKKQLEEEAQAWEDVRSAMTEYRRAQEQKAQELTDGNQTLRDEIELIGLSSKERARVMQQRSQAIILTKQATLAEMGRQAAITGTMTREQIALAAEIEGLQERNELLGAQEARESWTGFWESVNSTAHDTFVDVANNGMDAFKRIGKTLKSAVLDMLYQMTIKKWIFQIAGNMNGSVGGVGGVAQLAGGGTDWLGMASNASSIYRTGSTAAGWFGAGSAAGSSLATGLATTTTTSGVATGLGLKAGASGLGLQAGGQTLGGTLGSTVGGTAGGAGSGALTGMSSTGVGLIVAAALAAILWEDDSGTFHSGSKSQYSKDGGMDTYSGGWDKDPSAPWVFTKPDGSLQAHNFDPKKVDNAAYGLGDFAIHGAAGGVKNAQSIQFVESIAKGLVETLDDVAVTFGKKAGYEVATAFADDASKDGAWGALRISQEGKDLVNWKDTQTSKWAPKEFSNGEDGIKEYQAALAKDTHQVLLDMDLPSWADTLLNSIGEVANMDALSAALGQIGQIQTMFVQLGQTVDGFAGMGDKAFEALMVASGGADALAQSVGSFYENFYTEEERTAKATAALTAELAKSGVAMPASKEAYRALFEQQLKAGEGGAALAAKLLELNPAFAQTADAAEKTKKDMVAAAGISGETIASTLRDAMLGRMAASDAGAQIADMVTGGIYNAIAGGLAQQLTGLLTSSLITPVVQAAVAGSSISEAVSQSAIDNMVAQARAAADALGTIFSDPAFRAAIESVGAAIASVTQAAGGAAFKPYTPSGGGGGGGETVKDTWRDLLADIVRQTQDAGRQLNELGMTSYETALAAITRKGQESYDKLKEGGYIGKVPKEIQDWIDAETRLLNARNQATADKTIADLEKEVAQLGLTPLQKQLADIADRAAEYVIGLQDIGQATGANIAAVNAWEKAMSAAARESEAAALRTTATDDAFAALERAVGAQRDLLTETIQDLQAVFDMTRDAARDLYGEVESASQQSAAAGRAFIDQALANAQATGYMPDADGLRDAIDGVRKGIAAQQGASTFEAERDRLVLAGKLTDLKDLAEPQLTEAQRQLAALEEMLKTARTQIDELRGINVSVLSVAQAMDALAAAIAGEKAGTGAGAGTGTGGAGAGGAAALDAWGAQLLERNAATYASDNFKSASADQIAALQAGSTGGNIWVTADSALATLNAASAASLTAAGLVSRELTLAANSALSMADRTAYAYGEISAADLLSKYNIPGFAVGGLHAGGLRIVGENGPELEATGPSRIWNAQQLSGALGSGNTARLEALVEGLTAEVQRLQGIVARGVEHQRETAEILDNVTEGGSAMRSEVVA